MRILSVFMFLLLIGSVSFAQDSTQNEEPQIDAELQKRIEQVIKKGKKSQGYGEGESHGAGMGARAKPGMQGTKRVLRDRSPKYENNDIPWSSTIWNEVEYPQEAIDNRITGIAYVTFTVDTNWRIHDVRCDSNDLLGYGLDEAAIAFIKSTDGDWVPGVKDGKRANLEHTVSIDFSALIPRIRDKNNLGFFPTFYTPDGKVYRRIAEYKEGTDAMNQFISDNIEYPEEALDLNIEGEVRVRFMVEKDGSISNVRLVSEKRLGYGCDQEAVRVVKMMSGDWLPAMQRGRPVRMQFVLPVRFVPLTNRQIKKRERELRKAKKNKQ